MNVGSSSIEHTWNKRPGENDNAYRAFLIYRDMPQGSRTIIGAWRVYKGDDKAKQASGSFKNWHAKHEWEKRVTDYVVWLASKRREEAEADHMEKIKAFRARILTKAELTSTIAIRAMQVIVPVVTALKPSDITTDNLPKMVDMVLRLQNSSIELESMALGLDELMVALDEENQLIED